VLALSLHFVHGGTTSKCCDIETQESGERIAAAGVSLGINVGGTFLARRSLGEGASVSLGIAEVLVNHVP
jgi:hypothetical protein